MLLGKFESGVMLRVRMLRGRRMLVRARTRLRASGNLVRVTDTKTSRITKTKETPGGINSLLGRVAVQANKQSFDSAGGFAERGGRIAASSREAEF
jgi:hypothetical protein